MKNHDDVDWFYERDFDGKFLNYTHDDYNQAPIYQYFTTHVPTGIRTMAVIYGATEETGDKLVEIWGKSNPTIWQYEPVNPKCMQL